MLLVTFSRRASAELLHRVGLLTEPLLAARVVSGTFHSIAHRMLRRYGKALGLAERFSVLDQGDARDLMALIRAPVATGSRHRFPRVETVASLYGRVVSGQMPLEETVARFFPWCLEDIEGLRTVFTGYTERKRAQHLLDLEDLLLYWRATVRDPTVGPVLAERFDQVLVDEYQDTNLVQADTLMALARHGLGITVVGDDAQAIYSFRSATVRNILEFPSQFPGTTTVALEQNYRSTGPILALANTVIAEVAEGIRKCLWTELPGGVRPTLATCPDQQAQASAVSTTTHPGPLRVGDPAPGPSRPLPHRPPQRLARGRLPRRRRIPFVKYGGSLLGGGPCAGPTGHAAPDPEPMGRVGLAHVLQLARGAGTSSIGTIVERLGVRGPYGGS